MYDTEYYILQGKVNHCCKDGLRTCWVFCLQMPILFRSLLYLVPGTVHGVCQPMVPVPGNRYQLRCTYIPVGMNWGNTGTRYQVLHYIQYTKKYTVKKCPKKMSGKHTGTWGRPGNRNTSCFSGPSIWYTSTEGTGNTRPRVETACEYSYVRGLGGASRLTKRVAPFT